MLPGWMATLSHERLMGKTEIFGTSVPRDSLRIPGFVQVKLTTCLDY